jgi:ectoine hydroxylase-related dioxygenase (phytanoyl-CoA dioxygenase family)
MEGRSSSTRRLAHLSRLLAATPGPTATTTAAAPALSDADLETFNSEGVLVLRDFFSAEELAAISTPIAELQSAPGSPLLDESSKKFNFPDFQGLCQRPALATASFDHPRVVGAVQRALGEDAAELSQFGALTWAPDAAGVGLHYDYKPFRVVGSFLDWLFCIIPLTDYNEHDGPLLVRPRSHSFTTVLPHDDGNDPGLLGAGRVHQVDAAQVPPLETVQSDLVNPQLKRGDLLLMKGFTWHFADSNRPPSSGRSGLYMKFRAASSPPATGPLLFATEVAESLTHKQVMPYHREDGTQRIDQGTLVLEDAETHRVWAVGGGGGWQLPRWDIEPTAAMCSTTTAAWDSSNIIGELQAFALR